MRKSFDIKAARNGVKLVTRYGLPAKLISDNYYSQNYPLLFLITESGKDKTVTNKLNGGFCADQSEHMYDIFLDVEQVYKPFSLENAPVGAVVKSKKDGSRWVLIGSNGNGVLVGATAMTFKNLLDNYILDNGEPCGILES